MPRPPCRLTPVRRLQLPITRWWAVVRARTQPVSLLVIACAHTGTAVAAESGASAAEPSDSVLQSHSADQPTAPSPAVVRCWPE